MRRPSVALGAFVALALISAWLLGVDTGENLEVTFEDGEEVSYGPYKRPASIDRLRERMAAIDDE
jgi:hypothetical protein